MLKIFLLLATSCATVAPHGVPNLDLVGPGLYRGGEPTADGWIWLHNHGVRTVVQLDYDNERPKGVVPPDDTVVLHYSMPPSDADDVFRGPEVAELQVAASALHEGVFVHCLHGQDRTGAVVATYRHTVSMNFGGVFAQHGALSPSS